MNKILFPIILSVCSQLVGAQTTLTLDQCRHQAIEHNKELKQASLQEKEIEANKQAARTAYLPSVEFSSNLIYVPNMDKLELPGGFLPTATSAEAATNGDFSGESNVWSPGMTFDVGDLTVLYGGVSVMQAIYAGGKIRTMNKQADAGLSMAKYGVQLKYADVIKQTDKAFWTLATIQSSRDVADKYIEMLSELEEKLALMHETGLIPASERLKVSVQKNDAELQRLKTDNGIKIAKMYLNLILGQDLNTPIDIVYQQEAIVLDNTTDIATALSHRNELKIMEKKVVLSKLNKKLVQADYLPELGAGLNYNGFYVDKLTDDVSFKPMVAAQLKVPIFSWGQGRKKQLAADFKIKQAELDLSQTSDKLSLEIMQAQIQLDESWEAINIAKKSIAQSQESLDETQASFNVGLNTTSDLLGAQSQWLKANNQLLSAYAQYRIQQTEVNRVTGKITPAAK